jgi:hypothetical protein
MPQAGTLVGGTAEERRAPQQKTGGDGSSLSEKPCHFNQAQQKPCQKIKTISL